MKDYQWMWETALRRFEGRFDPARHALLNIEGEEMRRALVKKEITEFWDGRFETLVQSLIYHLEEIGTTINEEELERYLKEIIDSYFPRKVNPCTSK